MKFKTKDINFLISIATTSLLIFLCIATYTFKSFNYSAEGFINKADYFFSKGLYSDALKYYKKAISLGVSKDSAYLNLSVSFLKIGNYKSVFKYLDKIASHKEVSAEVYYLKGYAEYFLCKENNRSYEPAIECFEKSIQADQKFKQSYVFMGRIYEDLQQYEHARTLYRKALFADIANSEEFYGYIAYTYFKELRFDDALRYYERAVQTNKNYISAYCSIAEIYEIKGDKSNAEKYYKKAIALNSEYVLPYYKMGNLCYLDQKYEDAVVWFLKALELNPNSDVINYYTGMSYKKMNKLGEALKYLRTAAYCGSDAAVEELRTMLETF